MNDNDFNFPGHSRLVLNANRNLKARNLFDLIATDLRSFADVTSVAAELASVAKLAAARRQELNARSGRRVD